MDLLDGRVAFMTAAHPSYVASFGGVLPSLPLADSNGVSDAVVYLTSDHSRAVTGTQLSADMGATKV